MCSAARLNQNTVITEELTMQFIQRMTQKNLKQPWWKRVYWMLIIWFGSVLALFIIASLFRALMSAAGLKLH